MSLDKKIIAFDLDGTLTVSKSPITEEMAGLIKELAKQKVVVVISGGSFKQFQAQFLPPFHNDDSMHSFIHNIILLPTSGSQRYEYNEIKKEWELTDKEPLPENVKEKVKKVLEEVISSGLYDIPKNPKGEIIEDRDTQISFSALGQDAPIEEKMVWDPDQKKRQKIKAQIEPKIPEITVAIGGTTTLDILAKGFNKAVGLDRLLRKINLEKSDMVFVGDAVFPGGNDYSVLEAGIKTMSVKGSEETASIIRGWIG
ncbi:HAD-IIB family hydrolase [Candidatus Nomurabacteria bacterium]|nr:HAD-IIB family hydrolase [Candidatus Nomurabacteria bacterium]